MFIDTINLRKHLEMRQRQKIRFKILTWKSMRSFLFLLFFQMARESINFTTYLVISISKDIHKKFKILTFQINRKYWKVSINIPKIILVN